MKGGNLAIQSEQIAFGTVAAAAAAVAHPLTVHASGARDIRYRPAAAAKFPDHGLKTFRVASVKRSRSLVDRRISRWVLMSAPAGNEFPSSSSSSDLPEAGTGEGRALLMSRFDPVVYVVTDHALTNGRPLTEVVQAALAGGARVVQYRNKSYAASFEAEVRELLQLTRSAGGVFLVNDDPVLAAQIGADGVHVGQDDATIAQAREVVGAECIVGVSARTVEDAARAVAHGADYLGVGPVFRTTTKADAVAPLGLGKLMAIVRAVDGRVPVVGIGGMKEGNCGGCAAVGADGAAFVSAIMGASDPAYKAKWLRIRFEDGRPPPPKEA